MPDGTFFHRAGWARVIETAFGHPHHYVFAERDGAITGVLPLAQVKTLLFGDTLISMPFCVYGGPLAVDTRERGGAGRRMPRRCCGKLGATALEFRDRAAEVRQ